MNRPTRAMVTRVRLARWQTEPLTPGRGRTPGLTIQRHDLAEFLERHARDIKGRCLECFADVYTTRLGDPISVDIMDISRSNHERRSSQISRGPTMSRMASSTASSAPTCCTTSASRG